MGRRCRSEKKGQMGQRGQELPAPEYCLYPYPFSASLHLLVPVCGLGGAWGKGEVWGFSYRVRSLTFSRLYSMSTTSMRVPRRQKSRSTESIPCSNSHSNRGGSTAKKGAIDVHTTYPCASFSWHSPLDVCLVKIRNPLVQASAGTQLTIPCFLSFDHTTTTHTW